MRKKIIFIVFLFFAFSFLSLLVPDDIFAEYRCLPPDSYVCKLYAKGSKPSSICCRESSCKCYALTLSKWEYCYVDACCGDKDIWEWRWRINRCSAADSCRNTKYLQPGLCLDSGCAKGGDYKICCDNKRDGTTCPNVCIGGNTTGTCPSGCYNPGLLVKARRNVL